jgi:hypothetical protein
MGRKPKGEKALTASERKKLYNEKHGIVNKGPRKKKDLSEEKEFTPTQFIAIDGEGRNIPSKDTYYTMIREGENGKKREVKIKSEYQAYTLLCASTGDYIEDSNGLTSLDCLHFLCTLAIKYPKAQFVIFGGGYDANMWLRDMPYSEHKYLREWMEKDRLERVGNYKYPPALGIYEVDDVPHCNSPSREKHPCKIAFLIEWLQRKEFKATCVEWENNNFKYETVLYKNKEGEIKERRRRTQHGSFQCYDVYGFFGCKFMKALETFNLLENEEDADFLQNMKDSRRQFENFDNETIRRYCFKECEYLVKLMEKLERYCHELGLNVERWDGAGAIAAAMMKKYEVLEHIEQLPTDVLKAAQHAFAGGRIELIRYGHIEGKVQKFNEKIYDEEKHKRFCVGKDGNRLDMKDKEDRAKAVKELMADIVVWAYDLNSAYPHFTRDLPSLKGGTWKLEKVVNSKFAICHIKWDLHEKDPKNKVRIFPFFYRKQSGMIIYSEQGENWVWLPEYEVGLKHLDKYDGTIELIEVWNFYPSTGYKPFSFVDELARKRLEWKALYRKSKGKEGGQNIPAKLGLNSLYGKLAQQIGSHIDAETGEKVPPPFHNIALAGFVTSSTRAKMYDAAMINPQSVIMFATDGLFVNRPIEGLTIGEGLGEWELASVDSFTALQSGVYFSSSGDKQSAKTRGFEVGTITEQMVLDKWNEGLPKDGKPWIVTGNTHRFVTIGMLITGEKLWDIKNEKRYCSWESVPREQAMTPKGTKREIDDIQTPYRHKKWNAAKMLLPTIPARDEYYTPDNHAMSKAYRLLWLENDLTTEEKEYLQNQTELKEYMEME